MFFFNTPIRRFPPFIKTLIYLCILVTLTACNNEQKTIEEKERARATFAGGPISPSYIWQDMFIKREELDDYNLTINIKNTNEIIQWTQQTIPSEIQKAIRNKKIKIQIQTALDSTNALALSQIIKSETLIGNEGIIEINSQAKSLNDSLITILLNYVEELPKATQLITYLNSYSYTLYNDNDIDSWYQNLSPSLISEIEKENIKLFLLDTTNYMASNKPNDEKIVGISYELGNHACLFIQEKYFSHTNITVVQNLNKQGALVPNSKKYKTPVKIVLSPKSLDVVEQIFPKIISK